MIKNISIFLVLILVISGCAAQPEKYITSSGKPEVTFNAPLDKVKEVLIPAYLANGWSIVNDTQYATSFTKPCGDGFACAMGQVLLGNSYSTPPNFELSVSWIKVDGGTKVMVSSYNLSTQMAFGQVKRSSLMTSNSNFNGIIDDLRTFKQEIEIN